MFCMARHKEFDEAKVIESAMNAFWTHGYGATGTRSLATATGILPGSMHQAFGGKKGLFLVALDLYAQQALNGISATLAADGPVLENIRACLLYVARSFETSEGYRGCLMANTAAELSPSDSEATAKVRSMFIRMEDLFAGALMRAQAKGEISPKKDVRNLARLLVITIEGLQIYAKVQPQGELLSDIIDVCIDNCR
jgi:TetR/AcrR family transcriptional regulator, transcriptional repressor for nem operon